MNLKVGYQKLIEVAENEIKSISISEAAILIEDKTVVFVDVRDINEVKKHGEIPGSMHAPRGMLEFLIDPESPYHRSFFSEKKTFVFYCAIGWRSVLAAKTVHDMGIEKVANLAGGFSAWKAAGEQCAYVNKST